uniref:Uncharacterized protein n=1 Tax=viral metagenome TaxID=1070528 RepID=A0A6M3IIR2_9ZZZZ
MAAVSTMGAIGFGRQTYGTTLRKPTDARLLEATIGVQSGSLPSLYAAKDKEEQLNKEYDLKLAEIDQYTKSTQAELESLMKISSADIGANADLMSRREELETKLAEYKATQEKMIADRKAELESKTSAISTAIGAANVATTGALAYAGLKGAGVIGGGTPKPTQPSWYSPGPGEGFLPVTGAGSTGGSAAAFGPEGVGAFGAEGAGISSAPGGATIGGVAAPIGIGYGIGAISGSEGVGAVAGGAAGLYYGTSMALGPYGIAALAVAGAVSGILGGSSKKKCCFIFIASHGYLHPIVRRYRDFHMTTRNRRGYYWLADRLVPKMAKSRAWTWLVKWGMVKPMTSYGMYYYGIKKVGVVWTPVTAAWKLLYSILGCRPPYTRHGTDEIV